MGKPATLRVDILADSKKATAELDGFSSKVAGFTAGITSAFAGFALDKLTDAATASAGYLVDAVQNAAGLSAALSTLNQNYGAAAGIVETWAKKASDSLGISEQAAIKATNKFAVYARQLGLSGLDAAAFSAELVQTAADLGAYNDLPVEQAIQAIGSAFRGERDPLEQFGILLNDQSVKAAYFRKTGVEVNGTLTTQQNIVGTLAALQEQGATATGAFARESEQLGNKQQTLGAKMEDLSTRIGTVLLPVVDDLIGKFSGPLLTTLDDVVKGFEENGLSGAIGVLGKKWEEGSPAALGALDSLYTTVTTWIVEHVPDFAKWAAAAGTWITKAILGDGTDENPGLAVRLTEFVTALNQLSAEKKDEVGEAGGQLGSALVEGLFASTLRILGNRLRWLFSIDGLKEAVFGPGYEIIRKAAEDIGTKIGEWIVDKIKTWLIEKLGNAIKEGVSWVVRGLGGGLGSIAGGLFDAITGNAIGTSSARALTVNYYTTVNAEIPPGIHGWDAGAAIAASLEDYYARTGYKAP